MDAAGAADWLTRILQVLGAAGGLGGLVLLFLRYTNPADKVEQWVGEDREYRNDLADELRGGWLGGRYKHILSAGLAWVDQHFGAPASSRALGICIIIALYYSYAAFFVAWGIGSPSDIGGVTLLPETASWSIRLRIASLAATPVAAFAFGFLLARQELRIRGRLLTLRKRQIIVSILNSTVCPLIVSIIFYYYFLAFIHEGIGLSISMLLSFGVTLGVFAVCASNARLSKVRLSFLAGSLGVGLIFVAALFVSGYTGTYTAIYLRIDGLIYNHTVLLLSILVAGVVAGNVIIGRNIAVVLAASLAAAFAGVGVAGEVFSNSMLKALVTEMVTAAEFMGLDREGRRSDLAQLHPPMGLFAAMAASAVAAASGAFAGLGRHRGALAGGMGGLLGLGLATLFVWHAGNEIAITLVSFFLVLPLVNGVSDWLSWWVSRQLGCDLLAKLRPAASIGPRAWTVAWHASADLIAAALLLLVLDYLLALGFAVYDQMALSYDGASIFDLDSYVRRAAAAPWTDGLWLTVMLISTWSRRSCT